MEAKWVGAPLVVPKSPPANFRLTIAVLHVNDIIQPIFNFESKTGDMQESQIDACVDFPSRFVQLGQREDCQHLHTSIADKGIYKSTRTLQGSLDITRNFQSKVAPCSNEMGDSLKIWIDDFAIHSKTKRELVVSLHTLPHVCQEWNNKFSATDTELFQSMLKHCGRVIRPDDISLVPSNRTDSMKRNVLIDARKLRDYENFISWIQIETPSHARLSFSPRALLKKVYTKTGKRKKSRIKLILLSSLRW